MKDKMSAVFIGLMGLLFCAFASNAAAPDLLWRTSVGAKLFAVDEQSNVYAQTNGRVIVLSSTGQAVQTNQICPLPSIVKRDGNGDLFFLGSFDGTQDFGGITLVGGWTNWPSPGSWSPNWPTCFLAKYNQAGNLQWVTSFGKQSWRNNAADLLVDGDGSCYASYLQSGQAVIARFSNSGSHSWANVVSDLTGENLALTLGGLTTSNCAYLRFVSFGMVLPGRMSQTGENKYVGNPGPPVLRRSDAAVIGRPIDDGSGNTIWAGKCFDTASGCTDQFLRKCDFNGNLQWERTIPSELEWCLQRDSQGNIYASGPGGMLAKLDSDGFLVWSNNFGSAVVSLEVSSGGDRFLSFADGSVARLAPDSTQAPPEIVAQPQSRTVFVGDPVALSVTAQGGEVLHYSWRHEGTNLPGATAANLYITNASLSERGNYTVVVTNSSSTVTSAPALVRVKQVQFYLGSQMLTAGVYQVITPVTVSIRSSFVNGSAFYTRDGSAPGFASTPYTGAFGVSNSCTLKALGYSANFDQSEEADPISFVFPPLFTLSTSVVGPGSVTLNPPGGIYQTGEVVTLTATPASGWTFLYWMGDAAGANPSVQLTMDQARNVQAVFGTTLATTATGGGEIQRFPAAASYPYGTVVRLTAVPQPGKYFGVWGNAASGSSNPLYFTVTNLTPTVSSLFADLPAGYAALTVLIDGPGTVAVSPSANHFAINQTVTLTASPLPGHGFVNWGGDVNDTANPLVVSLAQSRVITGHFATWPELIAERKGMTPTEFKLKLLSGPGMAYEVLSSTNLNDWTLLCVVTNQSGQMEITDPGSTNSTQRFYKSRPRQ